MNGLEVSEVARFLDWDSRFFGKRIARVQSRCLTPEEAESVDLWCRKQHIDCVYYLAEGAKAASAEQAERHGFHLVDLRVTFNRDLMSGLPTAVYEGLREAGEGDLVQLKKMTHENHTISRFFADTHFDPKRSAEMYEVWIENDLRRENGQLWVKVVNDLAVAYTSVSLHGQSAEIGLVGVDSGHRRKGYGAEVVNWTLQRLAEAGMKNVEVVTQGRNVAAQVLYEKCGFVTKSIDLWYHKWF